jgi:acyl dehydratase
MLDRSVIGRSVDLGRRDWTSTDSILYALGVGCGQEDPTRELAFTTENSDQIQQQTLPTFAVVLVPRDQPVPMGEYPRERLLHAEQSLTLHREIPVTGSVRATAMVTGMYRRGEDAFVVIQVELTDATDGTRLASLSRTMFIRGAADPADPPWESPPWVGGSGEPDLTVDLPTRRDQALLYRLSGDRNPLHSDPAFAARAGYPTPLLHGLCTYGVAGRMLLRHVCDGDPTRFGSMRVRFTAPVIPGETLTAQVWRSADGVTFRLRVGDKVVLDRGVFTWRDQ